MFVVYIHIKHKTKIYVTLTAVRLVEGNENVTKIEGTGGRNRVLCVLLLLIPASHHDADGEGEINERSNTMMSK